MNEHIDKIMEDEFRKQFDELGLKPPKGSMPNLEREMIIDYWRKKLKENWNSAIKACEESLGNEFPYTVYLRSKFSQDCSRNETELEKNTEMMKCSDFSSHLSQTKEKLAKLLT